MRLKYVLILLTLPLVSFSSEKVIIGVHPYKSPSVLVDKYTPLAKYISKSLSIPVEIKISKDYQSHIESVGKNEFDIAYMGPASYVKLTEQFGKKTILARQIVNGKAIFKGAIVTNKNSQIKKLIDLKNKRFAFGDVASTMSHLVPRYMLITSGVNIKSLKKHRFYGSHDNVALAVLSGDADAGAVKEAVYYKYKKRGLKLLKFTPHISEHLFVATSKLKKQSINDIKNILISLSDSSNVEKVIMNSIKPGINGFTTAKDSDYDNLRMILKALNKDET